jgi:hypothetical protein
MAHHFASFSKVVSPAGATVQLTQQPIVFDDVVITNTTPGDDCLYGDGTTMVSVIKAGASMDFKNLDITTIWFKNILMSGSLITASGTWED